MIARRRFLPAKAAAIALVVGAAFLQPRPGRTKGLADIGPGIRRVVGRPALDILLAAQRAEVYRLVDDAPSGDKGDRRLISGYQLVRGPIALDQELLVAFRNELLSPATYGAFVIDSPPGSGELAKACGGFSPGVAVRFYEGAGAQRFVDALLCFHCGDIAIVVGGSRRAIVPQFMDMDPLLRLAAAAMPDDRALAELQAKRSDQRARDELFLGTFPAAAQVHLEAAHGAQIIERAAERLRRDIPEKELFRLSAQALGVRREDPETIEDRRTLVVARAVSTLSPEVVAAGLKDIANDQVALAGAQTLLLMKALDGLSVQVRDAWLPRLMEAALVQFPQTRWCVRMAALAAQPNKTVVPLLRRVARGELPIPPRRWEEEYALSRTPPARGCALMALGTSDPEATRAILPTFADSSMAPLHPLDLAAARAVRFRLGDQRALDHALLSVDSGAVQTYVLDTIRTRPTQISLGALIGYGLDKVRGADSVFTELTGFSLSYVPDERRATTAQEWWRANGATWRPPIR